MSDPAQTTDIQIPQPAFDATLPPQPANAAYAETLAPDGTSTQYYAGFTPPGYEILGELGRGGMGVVYKARHLALDRLVALKVILGAGHAGAEQTARFRAEATAAARLQHPHIVQIYENGEHQNQPFFSLEFIEGGTLAQHLKGEPQLFPFSAELIRGLALAVQHAHDRGIVHRDLKPGNVLLEKSSESPAKAMVAKITDFGLAKLQKGDSHLTASGAILGTPSYMPPEQAAGKDVGPAADIYSLGAILYECLTGRPPFRSATVMDTVLQVMSEEPVAPSRLQPKLPRDLETICLTCLAKNPAARYPSAAALAADLGRYLDDEPIQARPTSSVRKLAKWGKRHPALAGIIFLLAVPMPLLLAMMVFLWADSTKSRIAAEHERTEAVAARDAAERERNLTQGYLRTTISGVDRILDRLADERLGRIAGFHNDRAAMLDDGISLFENLLRVDTSEPTVRHETSQTYIRVARLGSLNGRHEDAIKAARAAIDLLEPLIRDNPERHEFRHDLARAYQALATVLLVDADLQNARGAYEKSVAIATDLVKEHPDEVAYIATAGEGRRFLGYFFSQTNTPFAREQFVEALKLADELYKRQPDSDEARVLLAATLGQFGQFLVIVRQIKEAGPLLLRGWELVDPAKRPTPIGQIAGRSYSQAMAALRCGLGQYYLMTKEFDKSEVFLKEGAAEQESLIRSNPKSMPYRLLGVTAYVLLGELESRKKAPARSVPHLDRALELVDGMLTDFPKAFWLRFQRSQIVLLRSQQLLFLGRIKDVEAGLQILRYSEGSSAVGVEAYNTACIFSVLMKSAASTKRDDYRQEAMKWLNRASATNFPAALIHIEDISKDTDLDPLRGTPEFEKWFKGLKVGNGVNPRRK